MQSRKICGSNFSKRCFKDYIQWAHDMILLYQSITQYYLHVPGFSPLTDFVKSLSNLIKLSLLSRRQVYRPACLRSIMYIFSFNQSLLCGTYVPRFFWNTRQLRSFNWSTKSKSWLMSYVILGQSGFCLFKCSSYILQIPSRHSLRDS